MAHRIQEFTAFARRFVEAHPDILLETAAHRQVAAYRVAVKLFEITQLPIEWELFLRPLARLELGIDLNAVRATLVYLFQVLEEDHDFVHSASGELFPIHAVQTPNPPPGYNFREPQLNPPVEIQFVQNPDVVQISWTLRPNLLPVETNARVVLRAMHDRAHQITSRSGFTHGEFKIMLETTPVNGARAAFHTVGNFIIHRGALRIREWWRQFSNFWRMTDDAFMTTSDQEISPFGIRYILQYNRRTSFQNLAGESFPIANGKK